MSETNVTLYVRDRRLWKNARKTAGDQGLSSLVEQALRQHLGHLEASADEGSRKFKLPIGNEGNMVNSIEFEGQLVADSSGFSLEQLPRIRIYRTVNGRLVVYRTWPQTFRVEPSYSSYPDLEGLRKDPRALATTWITESDRYGDETNLTPQLLGELQTALARPSVIRIDELEPSDRTHVPKPVRLGRDDDEIRRKLSGTPAQDALIVTMYLMRATQRDPRHLSEISKAFEQIKPVSRLGRAARQLTNLPAGMRGYLNNDARKKPPSRRLFTRAGRGLWGLSAVGETRANEVLHKAGIVRE